MKQCERLLGIPVVKVMITFLWRELSVDLSGLLLRHVETEVHRLRCLLSNRVAWQRVRLLSRDRMAQCLEGLLRVDYSVQRLCELLGGNSMAEVRVATEVESLHGRCGWLGVNARRRRAGVHWCRWLRFHTEDRRRMVVTIRCLCRRSEIELRVDGILV